ncbi:synaptonemal complex protein 3-like [Sphaeramia orbicularis]|uniref:synaptonemal complex protein 3-like n=1 Tax=Sphaeramia orbicularis TaxID=375764 RepID=UPI00117D30A2|nr:synaptonemal complex protein 3-like [Sphaeramia orbicularis]
MSTGRRQMKKKHTKEKAVLVVDFTEEDVKKEPSGSEEDAIEVDKLVRKRPSSHLEEEAGSTVGSKVQSILEEFRADISKVMQTRKERLECLTSYHMKESQHKVEQLWCSYHSQRQKVTQQYSQQVSCALQQWEAEAQRVKKLEERFTILLAQQQMVLRQARAAEAQKLKAIRVLFKQFGKNMEDMDKSHQAFLQEAQQELRKEMVTLLKKITMHTQRQEMATVYKSLQSML